VSYDPLGDFLNGCVRSIDKAYDRFAQEHPTVGKFVNRTQGPAGTLVSQVLDHCNEKATADSIDSAKPGVVPRRGAPSPNPSPAVGAPRTREIREPKPRWGYITAEPISCGRRQPTPVLSVAPLSSAHSGLPSAITRPLASFVYSFFTTPASLQAGRAVCDLPAAAKTYRTSYGPSCSGRTPKTRDSRLAPMAAILRCTGTRLLMLLLIAWPYCLITLSC
jgi:hypothetical protein